MFKKYRGIVQAGVSGASISMAVKMNSFMLKTEMFDWSKFETGLKTFFEDGMGGQGLKALGGALMVIGIFGAGLFFVIHKLNQQSSAPRPGGFLMVSIVGAVISQQDKLIGFFGTVRDTLFGWFGI